MNVRRPLLISLGMVAAMFIVSAWAWSQLPPGAQIPIHWGIDGKANAYAPKEFGLLVVPVIAVGLTLLFAAIPRIEPRRANLLRSGHAYISVWIGVLGLMLVVHVITVLAALGHGLDIVAWVLGGVGLLFVVIGNVLGKVRSNFFFGIRTPWTLSSDLSWNRTHRLGGRLFVVFGLVMVVIGLLGASAIAMAVLIGGVVAIVVVLMAYSYVVWRDDPNRHSLGSANQ